MALSPEQATFVEYYIRTGGCAAEAAMAAGIPLHAASQQATNWMCNAEVMRAINLGQSMFKRTLDDERAEVLQHTIALATSDITQAFYNDGDGDLKIRDLNDMPFKLRRAIKKIVIQETPVPYDDRPKRRITLELYSKTDAIAQCVRMLGLDSPQTINVNVKDVEAMPEQDLDTLLQSLNRLGRTGD
jgi:hypothetical protein